MLQKLRDQTQNTGFKILVGAIIVVLTLFGFGATNIFLGTDPEIAQVGDVSITQNMLALETERERMRILNRMEPEFDPATIDRQQLSQSVVQQVINKQIAYQTALELGLQVPAETVNETLTSSPAYQVDGQFNQAIYRQALQMQGYSPVDFIAEFTSALSAEEMQKSITDSLAITDWEVAELIRVINQQRDLAFLPLTIDNYSDKVVVTDEEIATRYDEEESTFMTQLMVDIEYVSVVFDDLVDHPSISVTTEELQGQYEDERSAALKDEQRDSSHILINTNDDRSDEEAAALVAAIAVRIEAGEAFDELAKSLSEDPGSASTGGSLGPAGKGIFGPAFEEALWALESVGDISGPIKSSFGYHLIRLDEIVETDYPALESQQEALTETVRRIKAQDLFAETARELEEFSYDEQTSLTHTADELGLTLHKVSQISRDTEDAKLKMPALLDAAFSDAVLAGDNSNAIALGEEELIVLRVEKQYPPELRPLQTVSGEIRDTLVREKALALVEENKTQGLARLQAGESVTEIANDFAAQWQSFEAADRSPRTTQDDQLPTEVRTFAFTLARPASGQKSVGAVALANGAALVTVTRVVQGDIDATLEVEATALKQAALERAVRIDFQSVMQAAEKELGVERPVAQVEET